MHNVRKLAAPVLLLLAATAALMGQQYKQTNLVASTPGIAPVTDGSLINAWGLARTSGGAWWVADNGTGVSTLYNGPGAKQALTVTIPKADPKNPVFPTGTPTGVIANGSTTDFLIQPGSPAVFIFATLDGTIAAWNPGVNVAPGATPPSRLASTVVKTTDGSVYTGLTSAYVGSDRFLYAANFSKGRIDIYDTSFHAVSAAQISGRGQDEDRDRDGDEERHEQEGPFQDYRLPRDFSPFNVQAIGNDVVVTYALNSGKPGPEIDGPGLGYVDVYSSKGKLRRRLQHGDWLNAPWGVALAPLDFGRFSHDLLVGQFGGGGNSESAGYIAAYDLATGKLDGLLQDATGKPLVIQGVWGLSVGNVAPANLDPAAAPAAEVYFAAGPNSGTAGLFGYVTAVPTNLIQGNDQ